MADGRQSRLRLQWEMIGYCCRCLILGTLYAVSRAAVWRPCNAVPQHQRVISIVYLRITTGLNIRLSQTAQTTKMKLSYFWNSYAFSGLLHHS